MRKIVAVMALFAVNLMSVRGQDYQVKNIPSHLKQEATVVVRKDSRQILINAPDNMVYKFKKAITVFDKNGREYVNFKIPYNKSRKIKSLNVNVYNEWGILVGKVKQSDFKDESYISNYSLFEDDRVKIYTPFIETFPVTFELECEVAMNQTLIIPDWFPQPDEEVSVQQSTLEISKPTTFQINYTGYGLDDKPQIQTLGKREVLTWKLEDLAAFKQEPYSPLLNTRLPNLMFSPVHFVYEGVSGNYSNWQEYGKWVNNALLKGRDVISKETEASVKNLVKDVKDKKEIVRLIYQYAQKKNRYISVQIGIGGFMPMKASEVDNVSYGDCKALCNYTMALLKAAGITAYYTEVYAGGRKVSLHQSFASGGQGNHIILYVPLDTEAIWLECTSKDSPVGYLGSFTQDRNVLVIKEDGGHIYKTPAYTWKDNLQIRSANITLDLGGNIVGKIETKFAGIQSENRGDIEVLSPVGKETYLKKIFPFPSLGVHTYQLDRNIGNTPNTREILKFASREYATVKGPYGQFDLNPLNVSTRQLPDTESRKNEVYINEGYTDVDSISYSLPKEFKVENLPISIVKSYPFGEYEFSAQLIGDNKILVHRKMVLKEGTYQKEVYKDLVELYKTAYRYDRSRCIVKRAN
ncbi:hypothetical protein Pedsa_0051 [Pseudopedobacter saltans DSM 12145]|uniref:DUF3857 domain-containing protein n=1 Tax=Pseudopedobacter saltans (strain ATCC 51119 / DSM 12145 / JCM 21818 / CCUG 39354 / LMG 10337 / NBRC 100064 / NCIMB 13643) TaxID=762903 RepID=F0SC55_PSESL|nr:DUF3857 domain-containing protein [Pseudopedobacter saltans]ADY50640.1 hypothetical protein Pedsa_0051 [Pseudopedobacter saltans DSM 12145]